ncbi:YchJ family protein [Marinobacterium arenosum]|uniref:YchJ family protein n=1 Tax=Marinobacterium arenosum TaxID=2862496 RepID=UPI001C96F64A|nr:YchJ family protein [Marinobacterium arenosum]MBY4677964.1 YchJ family protein [Marinobacterium arenosum]
MLHDQDISRKCPCGSDKPFSLCCEPAIEGVKAAATAEALMRSRYTAFSLGAVDYLIETTAAEKRRPEDAALLAEQVQSTLWVGLQVVDTERGAADDDWGAVEFVAHFETGDQRGELRERSNFRKEDNRWYYVDGEVEVRI